MRSPFRCPPAAQDRCHRSADLDRYLVVRRIPQAPNYPLVLMLDLFEIGEPGGSSPKTAMLHRFRGWETR